MEWNAKTQGEAQQIAALCDDKQWEMVMKIVQAVTYIPSAEEKEKQEQARKAEESAREQAKKDALEESKARYAEFREWAEKKLHGLEKPPRYDFGINDVEPLLSYALHTDAKHEGVYDTMSFMYNWGFKRGMAYQKAKAKQKMK